ncbi:hypothetical protein CBS147347_11193 [Aspergillus niger]|nr:hypothetical protein CBS147347_11193 [Aspergillus niger]
MAVPPAGGPENTPRTPENSARDRDEAGPLPVRKGRATRAQTKNVTIPAVEFPSLEDGKTRITTQVVGSLINNLKDIIQHQSTIIESTQRELQQLRNEQQILQNQNLQLIKEVRDLRARFDTWAASPQPRTWAAVAAEAAGGEAEQRMARPRKEPNCIRISTARPTEDADNGDHEVFTRYLPTDIANTRIRAALSHAEATKNTEVAGIGTTKTGYVIRFKDEQSATTARNNPEWLGELGNETKLVKPRFGVVVHRVPTEDFDLDRNKGDSIDKIMQENDLAGKGYQIEDIAWLKRKEIPLGRSATMGIWLSTPEAADFILNNGLLVGQRYIGSVEPYRVERKRCRRCQRFGHLAWSCTERVRCGYCAGSHDQRHCFPGLNIMKSRAGMDALINDHQTINLDLLLIQEPPISAYLTYVNHSAWRLYRPTYTEEATRFRSLLYVNKRLSTSSHRQIRCNHPDVVAVKIWTADIQYLVFSLYIPPVTLLQPTHESSAQQLLDPIQRTIEEHSSSTNRTTQLILAGDFNRHHPAWNHQPIAPRLIEHADELINFFQMHQLQWCLPRGIPTYWAVHRPGQSSTIDLTVTDDPARLIRCQLYHDNYGSDHRGTLSEWDLQPRRNKPSNPKRAYDRANWEKIGQDIQSQTTTLPTILSTAVTTADLDQAVEKLISSTIAALDRHIPSHRPSPYSKRWFSPALKAQQTCKGSADSGRGPSKKPKPHTGRNT